MFDTLTAPRDTGEFETIPGARPDPGTFLTGGAHRHTRSCRPHEGSGGTFRRTAERHY